MAAPMEVSLPQTMLQKLLDLLKLESLKFCLKIHVHVIHQIRCQVNIDYHNQHESAALIGLFHVTSLVLPSVESYRCREEYRGTSPLCSGEYDIADFGTKSEKKFKFLGFKKLSQNWRSETSWLFKK